MEKRPESERLLLCHGEIHPVGQQRRIETDSAAVVEKLSILRFQQLGEQRKNVRCLTGVSCLSRFFVPYTIIPCRQFFPCLSALLLGTPERRLGAQKLSQEIETLLFL